jgi:hypothetical protein
MTLQRCTETVNFAPSTNVGRAEAGPLPGCHHAGSGRRESGVHAIDVVASSEGDGSHRLRAHVHAAKHAPTGRR